MPISMDERARQLIAGLVQARAEVIEAVRAVPPTRVDELFLGTWTIKDLLAHLEGWDFTNMQAVREILAGIPPDFFQYYDKDWHSYNQGLVEKYKREDLGRLMDDIRSSHQQLVNYLETLTAGDLVGGKAMRETGRNVTIQNLLRAEARDEIRHAGQVRDYFGPLESE